MATLDGNFKLRGMLPSDSAAVINLITEFDGDMTTRFLVDAFAAITAGTENETVGVVVEAAASEAAAAGAGGLVGMGTVRFDQVQFNGETLPLAFLDGLKVHKDFRGQGIGYQIANWRIQRARERFGERCVIATGMLQDNHASRAVAKKWCREFIDPVCQVLILPARRKPPKPLDGVRVCEVEPRQFEEFASRQNRFYQDYNLYPPASPQTMANALAVSAEGRQPYRFYAALDTRGNLLAGAQTWARGMLKTDKINKVPAPVKALNPVVHLLPSDYIIRDITVSELWYASEHIRAARFLWESIRWQGRDQGTNFVAAFDPRDPVREVIEVKLWHQPRPLITMAIHGPGPIDRGKVIVPVHRV